MKKKILIFTCLFTFILSIGLFGTKASANADSYITGNYTPVSNVENVSLVNFNVGLPVNYVVEKLSQLTYYSTPFLQYPIYPILFNSDGSCVIFAVNINNSVYQINISTDIVNQQFTEVFTSYNNTGWQKLSYSLSNTNVLNNYSGIPVGTQNSLISDIISSDLFPVQQYYLKFGVDSDTLFNMYMDGYNKGYADGQNDGSSGYDDGYNAGYGDGHCNGYNEGLQSGYADGYDKGFDDGKESVDVTIDNEQVFNDGYAQGNQYGYENGFEDGYIDGYDNGRKDGFELGYNDGISKPVNYFTYATYSVYTSKDNTEIVPKSNFEKYQLTFSGINFVTINNTASNYFADNNLDDNAYYVLIEFDNEHLRPSFNDFVVGLSNSTTIGVDITFYMSDGLSYRYESFLKDDVIDLRLDDLYDRNLITKIKISNANADYACTSIHDLNSSYVNGYNQGYNIGNYDGYNTGLNEGYNTGYQNGYDVGIQVDGNWNLKTLFWTIAGLPFETFKSIWNFEFLGFNIAKFFTGFLMVFIVLYVIKKILK